MQEKYSRTNWTLGQTITEDKLNNIESGLTSVSQEVVNAINDTSNLQNSKLNQRIQNTVIVSQTQPTDPGNKIWINPTSDLIELPTVDEIEGYENFKNIKVEKGGITTDRGKFNSTSTLVRTKDYIYGPSKIYTGYFSKHFINNNNLQKLNIRRVFYYKISDDKFLGSQEYTNDFVKIYAYAKDSNQVSAKIETNLSDTQKSNEYVPVKAKITFCVGSTLSYIFTNDDIQDINQSVDVDIDKQNFQASTHTDKNLLNNCTWIDNKIINYANNDNSGELSEIINQDYKCSDTINVTPQCRYNLQLFITAEITNDIYIDGIQIDQQDTSIKNYKRLRIIPKADQNTNEILYQNFYTEKYNQIVISIPKKEYLILITKNTDLEECNLQSLYTKSIIQGDPVVIEWVTHQDPDDSSQVFGPYLEITNDNNEEGFHAGALYITNSSTFGKRITIANTTKRAIKSRIQHIDNGVSKDRWLASTQNHLQLSKYFMRTPSYLPTNIKNYSDLSADYVRAENLKMAVFIFNREGIGQGIWDGHKIIKEGHTLNFEIYSSTCTKDNIIKKLVWFSEVNIKKIRELYKDIYPDLNYRLLIYRPGGTINPEKDAHLVHFYTKKDLPYSMSMFKKWGVVGASSDSAQYDSINMDQVQHYTHSWPAILARECGNEVSNYARPGRFIIEFLKDAYSNGNKNENENPENERRGMTQVLKDLKKSFKVSDNVNDDYSPYELYVLVLGGNDSKRANALSRHDRSYMSLFPQQPIKKSNNYIMNHLYFKQNANEIVNKDDWDKLDIQQLFTKNNEGKWQLNTSWYGLNFEQNKDIINSAFSDEHIDELKNDAGKITTSKIVEWINKHNPSSDGESLSWDEGISGPTYHETLTLEDYPNTVLAQYWAAVQILQSYINYFCDNLPKVNTGNFNNGVSVRPKIVLTIPHSGTMSPSVLLLRKYIYIIGEYFGIPVIDWFDDEFMRLDSTLKTIEGGHPIRVVHGGKALAFNRLLSKVIKDNPTYFNDQHKVNTTTVISPQYDPYKILTEDEEIEKTETVEEKVKKLEQFLCTDTEDLVPVEKANEPLYKIDTTKTNIVEKSKLPDSNQDEKYNDQIFVPNTQIKTEQITNDAFKQMEYHLTSNGYDITINGDSYSVIKDNERYYTINKPIAVSKGDIITNKDISKYNIILFFSSTESEESEPEESEPEETETAIIDDNNEEEEENNNINEGDITNNNPITYNWERINNAVTITIPSNGYIIFSIGYQPLTYSGQETQDQLFNAIRFRLAETQLVTFINEGVDYKQDLSNYQFNRVTALNANNTSSFSSQYTATSNFIGVSKGNKIKIDQTLQGTVKIQMYFKRDENYKDIFISTVGQVATADQEYQIPFTGYAKITYISELPIPDLNYQKKIFIISTVPQSLFTNEITQLSNIKNKQTHPLCKPNVDYGFLPSIGYYNSPWVDYNLFNYNTTYDELIDKWDELMNIEAKERYNEFWNEFKNKAGNGEKGAYMLNSIKKIQYQQLPTQSATDSNNYLYFRLPAIYLRGGTKLAMPINNTNYREVNQIVLVNVATGKGNSLSSNAKILWTNNNNKVNYWSAISQEYKNIEIDPEFNVFALPQPQNNERIFIVNEDGWYFFVIKLNSEDAANWHTLTNGGKFLFNPEHSFIAGQLSKKTYYEYELNNELCGRWQVEDAVITNNNISKIEIPTYRKLGIVSNYNAETIYNCFDRVLYSGQIYVSLGQNNINHEPTTNLNSWWSAQDNITSSPRNQTIEAWDSSGTTLSTTDVKYWIGEQVYHNNKWYQRCAPTETIITDINTLQTFLSANPEPGTNEAINIWKQINIKNLYSYHFKPKRTYADLRNDQKIFPKIILVAGTHSSGKNAIFGLYYLIRNIIKYHDDDPLLDYFYNNVQLVMIPCLNPFGLDNSYDYDYLYKKAFNYNTNIYAHQDLGKTNSNYVNIDRNGKIGYVHRGGFVKNNNNTFTISTSYSGPTSNSEAETRSVYNLIAQNNDSIYFIDFNAQSTISNNNWGEIAQLPFLQYDDRDSLNYIYQKYINDGDLYGAEQYEKLNLLLFQRGKKFLQEYIYETVTKYNEQIKTTAKNNLRETIATLTLQAGESTGISTFDPNINEENNINIGYGGALKLMGAGAHIFSTSLQTSASFPNNYSQEGNILPYAQKYGHELLTNWLRYVLMTFKEYSMDRRL